MMKRILTLAIIVLCALTATAQVEYLYDFNNLTTGTQCLNGQDNWSTHYQTASTSQDFDLDYTCGSMLSPDESIAVYYPYGGPGVGRTATRKATDNFNFNFQNGGIMDLEMDACPVWWGWYYGVGFDSDNDGNILVGMTDGDGGIYLRNAGSGNEHHPNLQLPDGTSILISSYTQTGWARFKMSFDFNAFDGAGSVTVFVKDFVEGTGWGEWNQLTEATEVNMGLTVGSGDKFDYSVWDGVFFHCQGGTGGFDNLLVRQMPEGNVQYINMPDIPKQLITNPPYTLAATSTSGLPVSYEMVSGPATISGNIMTLTGEVGTVTLKATQGGDENWLPAPDVFKTFEVIDATAYAPEFEVRRPFDGTTVYLPNLKPIVLCVSAYIEHPDALHVEEIRCTVDGSDVILNTEYPEDPGNGYFFNYWEPSHYGDYNMTVAVTTTGGVVTTKNVSFTVTNEYSDMNVVTLNGDLICTPSIQSAIGNYVMPTHVGAFSQIMAHYDHNCVNGNCDTYDRVGGVKIRNYRGEWVELFRYISPFGVQCEDYVDVSDYTSLLQGEVEFMFYFESWNGDGYNPILTFEMTKGTPDYLYADVDQLWFDTYPFGDYNIQAPVPVVNYDFNSLTEAAKLKITTTGHNWSSNSSPNYTYNTGNAAEFYEATHNININNQTEFTQHLWQTCNPNPASCSPQNGTWTYNRAGWCPGSIAMVWDFDLTSHVSEGSVEVFYEFDPTYLDLCHPNHPDCVNGTTCTKCDAPDNPILRVAGNMITYSNNINVLNNVNTIQANDSFNVDIYPNPAEKLLSFTTDYELGKVSVQILNTQGQVVRKFAFSGSRTINIEELPAGMYFVNILGDKMITKKVIVK